MQTEKSQSKFQVILFACLMLTLTQAGITFYLSSFLSIQKNFQCTNHLVALTLTAYMLGYALLMLFWGTLADHIGRKKVLLITTGLFSLASFSIAFIHSINLFILLRFIQGAGGGGCAVVSRTSIRDITIGPALAKAMTYASMAFIISLGIWQTLGGFIEHYFNWRIDFWCMGIISAIYGLLLLFKFQETKPITENMLTPIFSISNIFNNYLAIFKNSYFIKINIVGGIGFGLTVAFNTISPYLFMHEFNLTPANYGYIGLILSGAYLLGAICSTRLISKIPMPILIK